ncbi:MAG: AmmeMemoRadiSam system radical SAM enzyme [Candidatus Eisenbacteria bacterium]|nr:AmmeMemoRadiSam system radical SAM enzyme [Candidatus Eisenbacteria bacterium]
MAGRTLVEAEFYNKLDSEVTRCVLCPHHCTLKPGKTGLCLGKTNIDGTLYAVNYGQVASVAVDPIEKKPLYHFYPGSQILSVGPNGCNLRCIFCQNWEISQTQVPTSEVSPEELVSLALRRNSIGISYTYSEPLIWYEFLMKTAALGKERGLVNVLVTNGMLDPDPWRKVVGVIDAMNIDVKSMEPRFYRKVCKGYLEPVLRNAEEAKKSGVHIEITNLLVPTLNDSDEKIERLVEWVSERLGRDTPLHFSRCFPQYKLDGPPTPIAALERAWEIGKRKLDYVYLGNVMMDDGRDTLCPGCGETLVERIGYSTRVCGVADGGCKKCGRKADIVGLGGVKTRLDREKTTN